MNKSWGLLDYYAINCSIRVLTVLLEYLEVESCELILGGALPLPFKNGKL